MNTLSLSISIDSDFPGNFMLCHSTTKVESADRLRFQRIGLAFQEADLVAYRISDNPYAAKAKLIADFINMGLGKYEAAALISAESWDDRMRQAWILLSIQDQEQARQLDYQEFENYWPNLKFTDSHWPQADQ